MERFLLSNEASVRRPSWQQQSNTWATNALSFNHQPGHGMHATGAETFPEALDDEAEYEGCLWPSHGRPRPPGALHDGS